MKILIFSLFLYLSAHGNSQVWYTSNVATPDLLDMFTQPQRWSDARSRIQVLKLYQQQLAANSKDQCEMCENNIFPFFLKRKAFDKLKEWNIELAIEGGAVKPNDCDATENTRSLIELIEKLKRIDTRLYAVALDEPFISGKEYCNNQDESLTAQYVKGYVDRVQNYHQQLWPNTELKVGLIEAYPAFRMPEIIRFVQKFIQFGYQPAFVHLDIDRNYMKGLGINDSKFKSELLQIKAFLQRYNIPLGIIYWGQEGNNRATHAKNIIDFANRMKRLYGPSDHVGIQAWDETSGKRRLIPDNLSDNQVYTGTNLTIQVLNILGI